MSRSARPAIPGTATDVRSVDEMIRVDHAGEFGALQIYKGQLAVLGHRDSDSVRAIRSMAAAETEHFAVFDRMVKDRGVRPTALEPLWRAAGYALGAATALMGEKAAMACTVAVEEVIDEHYRAQVERMPPGEPVLKHVVEDFRADELEHRDLAFQHGAEDAPAYRLLSSAIRLCCRTAIALSEKI